MKAQKLALDLLVEHPSNPRGKITQKDVADLAKSLEVHGLLSPIVVKAQPNDGVFQILAGHRRVAAARSLGWKEIDAAVYSGENDTAIVVIENAQHVPPNVLAEAELVAEISDDLNVSEVADLLGKPAVWVAQRRALAKLSPKWRKVLKSKPAD
jgi:ParB family chromosome partitioning protein